MLKEKVLSRDSQTVLSACFLFALSLCIVPQSYAQTAISSINASYNSVIDNSDNYTEGGVTYRFNSGSENNLLILAVDADGRTFEPARFADRIAMQRVSISNIPDEREIYFYEGQASSGSIDLKPSYLPSMQEVLLNPVLNRGVDNIFQNVGDNNGNVNNVMRLDFIFDGGISIPSGTSDTGFIVKERGGNDPIKIAAITSLDANGNPASFGPVVGAESSEWGDSQISLRTQVMRRPNASSNLVMTMDLSPQPMAGILFTFEDLGLTPGDVVYGYALAAGDAPSNSADWMDVSLFPTNTDAASGGLDLIAGGAYFSADPVISAEDDAFTTSFQTPFSDTVADNDVFQNGSQFEAVTQPSNGSLALNTDGSFSYTPNSGFEGTDEFTYTVCLPAPIDYICDTALVTIDVGDTSSVITNLFPANGPGTLAYEDLWPSKGDFDFNDVVVDYQFEVLSDEMNIVQKIEANFTLRAFGAGFRNGFGFQLNGDVQASDIEVSGYSLTEDFITLTSNGTEANQTLPTIVVFDNAYNEMQHPGSGTGVNTEPGAPYVTPATFTITIEFTGGSYTYNDLNISDFKPFIIVDRERGREVHLPGNAPTDLADMSYFGTRDDASDASQGFWYVTENNLPWAINVVEQFDYPIERTEISEAYLKFIDWAQSGGTAFTDWFSNTSSNYRDSSKIYQEE